MPLTDLHQARPPIHPLHPFNRPPPSKTSYSTSTCLWQTSIEQDLLFNLYIHLTDLRQERPPIQPLHPMHLPKAGHLTTQPASPVVRSAETGFLAQTLSWADTQGLAEKVKAEQRWGNSKFPPLTPFFFTAGRHSPSP